MQALKTHQKRQKKDGDADLLTRENKISIPRLPEFSGFENIPRHAREIYREAFNSAFSQYGDEDRAHRIALSAIKDRYSNEDDAWISDEVRMRES